MAEEEKKTEMDPIMNNVYGGPEQKQDPRETFTGFVYAGPKDAYESAMKSAYAGPSGLLNPMMMAVYAGPEQMPVTLMAYAGPNMPNQGGFLINQIPAQKDKADEDARPYRFCPECGARSYSGNFCGECGKPLKDQPWYRTCKCCGTQIPDGQKFCHECGAPTAERKEKPWICPTCGTEVGAGQKFCPECGGVPTVTV